MVDVLPKEIAENFKFNFVIAAHSDWLIKGIEIPASEIILHDKMVMTSMFIQAMLCLPTNIIKANVLY